MLVRMLYDFHEWQNNMRPGTVHATYLLYGTRTAEKLHQDGDVEMTSSAPEHAEPLSEDVTTYTLSVVQEARLEGEDILICHGRLVLMD
jgi:DNA polymerase delta subunit 3